MKALRGQGLTHFMAIPVAFTTDHVETLYEIDIEFGEEAKESEEFPNLCQHCVKGVGMFMRVVHAMRQRKGVTNALSLAQWARSRIDDDQTHSNSS